MEDKVKIGIIDSGTGGKYVSELLMNNFENIVTFQYTPDLFESYSALSMERLFLKADKHLQYLKELDVDVIVVGCMTMSTNCLHYIKEKAHVNKVYDLYTVLPFIHTDTIVLATDNTIKSGRFDHCIKVPCGHLSTAIQNGRSERLTQGLLWGFLKQHNAEPGRFVYGCSHYLWHKHAISQVMGCEGLDPVEYLIREMKLNEKKWNKRRK